MIRYAFAAGVLLSMAANASADSMYCSRELVRAGDPIWQVARKCPQPFWREQYDRASAADRFGRPLELQRLEVWTLNLGSKRLMRRLVFVDGRLARIHPLGYGIDYTPGTRSCTHHQLNNAGDTIAEVYARCGEPDYSYELPTPGLYGFHGGRAEPQDRRAWTYDFGTRHHPRELLFIDGRLQTIRKQRR